MHEETDAPDRAPRTGDVYGEYVLQRCLGEGSSARVFAAYREEQPEQRVALKLLRRRHSHADCYWRRSLEREARILKRTRHPNVLELRQAELEGDSPFLVLELVQGETLAARCEAGRPLPEQAVLSIAVQLLKALAYLHEERVVYRDLNKDNVLLEPDGRLVLLDFGLCLDSGSPSLTQRDHVHGTPCYLPPEAWDGEYYQAYPKLLPSWDVYTVGVLLAECLSGRNPFDDVPFSAFAEVKNSRGHLDVSGCCSEKTRHWIRKMTRRAQQERCSAQEAAAGIQVLLERSGAAPCKMRSSTVFTLAAEEEVFDAPSGDIQERSSESMPMSVWFLVLLLLVLVCLATSTIVAATALAQ